jgi:hypothetical protein
MMTQIQVQVPDYFTLKHYKSLQHLKDIEDEIERKLMTVAVFTNRSYDDVMNWNVNSIIEITDKIEEVLSNIKPEFYPIIEWNGKLWGYSSMQNMSVGEYVDLDNLCKDTDANINEILAILIRPVTENNLQSSKFVTRSTFKSLKYEVENVFDYYKIEEYDFIKRKHIAGTFDDFPAEIALGAMAFFLGTKTMLLKNTQVSSPNDQKELVLKMNWKKRTANRLLNTMGGFIRSRSWQILPSYKSQVTSE